MYIFGNLSSVLYLWNWYFNIKWREHL